MLCGLVAASDPLIQVWFFFTNHRGVTVAGEHFGVLRQREDLIFDGFDNGIEA